jgi:hypothetical protein
MGIGLDDGVELHRHVAILPERAAAAFWDAGKMPRLLSTGRSPDGSHPAEVST